MFFTRSLKAVVQAMKAASSVKSQLNEGVKERRFKEKAFK